MKGTTCRCTLKEWAAIQISSFLERAERMDGKYLQERLEELDSLFVCREIIRLLVSENLKRKRGN